MKRLVCLALGTDTLTGILDLVYKLRDFEEEIILTVWRETIKACSRVLTWQRRHLQWPQLPVRTVWWIYSSAWSTERPGLHITGSSPPPCEWNSLSFMYRLEYQPFFINKVLILANPSGQRLLKLNLLRRAFSSNSFKSAFWFQG